MKVLVLAFLLMAAGACSHTVTDDYQQYLNNNQGKTFPSVGYDVEYVLTPKTKGYTHSFKSAMGGLGNSWTINVGTVLDATLKSQDVQSAFKSLKESSGKGSRVLTFDVEEYVFANHRAKIRLSVTETHNGKATLKKTYEQEGISQGGKMFWGGAMAMKNAVQQSTKDALDKILTSMMTDLKAKR